MSKFVVTDPGRDALACALCEAAGVKAEVVSRMVLDLQVGHPGMLYLETYADDAMLDVSIAQLGVEIREASE